MRGSEKKTKLEAQENSTIWMEMYFKDNGKKINQMAMKFICMQMDGNIREIGKRIFSVGMALRLGLMEVAI